MVLIIKNMAEIWTVFISWRNNSDSDQGNPFLIFRLSALII